MLGEPDPQHWRDCAKDARAKADQMKKNQRSKRRLLDLADGYESLAERVEQHAWKRRRGVTRVESDLDRAG